jgi:hypothetical protein
MPRSADCGFLSKQAVEAVVETAFTREVLPLSTWPSTPMLKLSVAPGPAMAPSSLLCGTADTRTPA